MTTFTITTSVNLNSLTGKTGTDTYTIQAGSLTIDTDTRYGLNQSATSVLGSVSIDGALGGNYIHDSTNVKLIPFNNGSGLVPASGVTITQGSVTSELICVMLADTGNVIYSSGSSMPVSGWLKVKNISGGSYTNGTLSNINCSVNGSIKDGWIMIVADAAKSTTIPRLGKWTIKSNDYYVGVTNGIAGQTINLPYITSEATVHYAGVEIETSPGSNIYDFYPNAASTFTSANQGTDSRSQNVYISNKGIVTIGMGTDNSICGYLPVSGCKVRIPGVIHQMSTGASSNNSDPSSTLTSRHQIVTTSSGTIEITGSGCISTWYWNLVQIYSIKISKLIVSDSFIITNAGTYVDIDKIYVGLSTINTNVTTQSILLQQNTFGGKIQTANCLRYNGTTTSSYGFTLTISSGDWTLGKIKSVYALDPTSISGCFLFNQCPDKITIDELWGVGKRALFMTCNNVIIKSSYKADTIKGTTLTTLQSNGIEFQSGCNNILVENYNNWPDAPNSHPYNALILSYGSKDLTCRNFGISSSPIDMGTINPCGLMYADNGFNANVRLQRSWFINIKTNIFATSKTSKSLEVSNCYNVDASKTVIPLCQDTVVKGVRALSGTVQYGYTSVYGTVYMDAFTSDTTTRLFINYTEATQTNTSVYQVEGSPKFSSQGTLILDDVGDRVTWIWPYYILGSTGLTSWQVAGANISNHTFEYDLDKGNGFSNTWKTLTNANLASETGILTTGFKVKVRVTCNTASPNNLLRAFAIDGTCTLSSQNSALYDLDIASLTINNLVVGSIVSLFKSNGVSNGQLEIATGVSNSSNMTLTYPYDIAQDKYTLRIRKAGYGPIDIIYDNAKTVTQYATQVQKRDGLGQLVLGRGTGATSSLITIDPLSLRIKIGNGIVKTEDLYDTMSAWQATMIGMRYPEGFDFDGTDSLLLNNWMLKRNTVTDINAGLDTVPVVFGNVTSSPDDETNGSVDCRARNVRTYSSNQSQLTAVDVAAAVWAYQLSSGSNANDTISNMKSNVDNSLAIIAAQ
jgi:hypothetical protein